MEEDKLNNDLEELFSRKFENSELVPGDAVRKNLMKRLGRKEFIRFNPSRFNIYYLAVAVAAGAAAVILLVSGPDETGRKDNIPSREQTGSVKTLVPVNSDHTEPVAGIKAENKTIENSKVYPDPGRGIQPGLPGPAEKMKEQEGDRSEARNKIIEKQSVKPGMPVPESVGDVPMHIKPVADFNASPYSGCTPLRVKFTNRSFSFDSCLWLFGDGGHSNEKDPEWIYDIPGEYKVTLQLYGKDGSSVMSSEKVIVYPGPVARFEAMPQKPILPDDEIRFLNYSRDAVRYRWEFGDGKVSEAFEPEHKYAKYDKYNVRLVVWSAHGCSDSMTVINAFSESGCFIEFPNAFIPNSNGPAGGYYTSKSDESAQIFHPVTSGVSEYQLRVFSRLGILIFETSDINNGWDGYHKGVLCEPGVYVWKVRGTYKNGESFVKTGDVILIRQ